MITIEKTIQPVTQDLCNLIPQGFNVQTCTCPVGRDFDQSCNVIGEDF